MDIVNKSYDELSGKVKEIELVIDQEKEKTLRGRFLRRRGLRLYTWDSVDDSIREVEVSRVNTIHLVSDAFDKELVAKDGHHEEVFINDNSEYFQALNARCARKRVERFRSGKLKSLFNLVPVSDELDRLKMW